MVKEQSEKSPSSLFGPEEHPGAHVNFEDGAGPHPRPGSSRLALCPTYQGPPPSPVGLAPGPAPRLPGLQPQGPGLQNTHTTVPIKA